MLEGLRTASQNWIGRIVLSVVMGFIILSFAIWGINDMFRGYGTSQLARIGGEAISIDSFRNAYQLELSRLQRQLQRPISSDQARELGLESRVLSKLVTDATLDQRAQSLHLALSDEAIAKTIQDDPSFKGSNGKFDKNRFDALLREAGLTERGFVREQRSVYLRQQLTQAIAGDLTVPLAVREAFNRYANETRSLDYVVLPAAAAGEIPAPDDATLQKFFDDRQETFKAPEYRTLVVLAVTPTTLAHPESVSDSDAQKLYDQVKSTRFGTPEQRDLRQVVFPDPAAAATAAQRIKSGARLGDIAAEQKLQPVDLGLKSKAEIFDKQIAETGFALPEGGVSDPVQSAFGVAIVEVARIVPENVKPFPEVAAELKSELAVERARENVQTLHDTIEDQRASGKPLVEAAKVAGLSVRTIDAIDASGRDPSGKDINDLPERDALLRAAFASEPGADNETVSTKDRGYIWFEVAKIDPARNRPLAEVKSEVESAWRADETAKRLAAKTTEFVKQINQGGKLAEIAAENGGLEVKHLGNAKRSGAEGVPPGVVAQVFNVAVGAAGSAAGQGDTRILFQVLDSNVPPLDSDKPESKQLAEVLKGSFSQDLLEQYVAQLQKDIGIHVNQHAMRQVTGSGGDTSTDPNQDIFN
jgi:peptidyl-prolyl cis-trans isomerase D